MGVRKFDHGLDLPPAVKGDRPIDRDRLAMVPRTEALRVALEAFHPIQSWEGGPEQQALGVAVLFAALARRCGLPADMLHGMAVRVLDSEVANDAATNNMQQVLVDLMGSRIMAQEVTIG